jgi:hypothetical protein
MKALVIRALQLLFGARELFHSHVQIRLVIQLSKESDGMIKQVRVPAQTAMNIYVRSVDESSLIPEIPDK